MSTFRNSIGLVKASWRVLRSDPELIWLPIMSFVAWVIVVASFALPIVGLGALSDGQSRVGDGLDYVLMAIGYLVLSFVTIFFNAAVVFAANERLEGRDPDLRGALVGAARHWPRILGWSIVTTTVNVILRAIAERFGFLAAIITGLVGMAWSIVTFLVLPILVLEEVKVGASIKRSASLFKHTWGENVVGNAGVGLVGFLLALPGMALVGIAVWIGVSAETVALAVGIGVIGGLWLAVVAPVMAALSGIFQTALYRFAADGTVPESFADTALPQSFRPKEKGVKGIFRQ